MNQRAYGFAKATLDFHLRRDTHAAILEEAREAVSQAEATMGCLRKLGQKTKEDEIERLRRENTRLRALVLRSSGDT